MPPSCAALPISRSNQVRVSDRGYNIVADHRARADTVPGDRGSRAEQASATLEEERMATEPTGSMPEGMQGNGSPTELPSIPTGDLGEVRGARAGPCSGRYRHG